MSTLFGFFSAIISFFNPNGNQDQDNNNDSNPNSKEQYNYSPLELDDNKKETLFMEFNEFLVMAFSPNSSDKKLQSEINGDKTKCIEIFLKDFKKKHSHNYTPHFDEESQEYNNIIDLLNEKYDEYLTKKDEVEKKDQKRIFEKKIEDAKSLYGQKKKDLEQIINSKINNFVEKVFSYNPNSNYEAFKFFRKNNLKFLHGTEDIEKNKKKLKEFLKTKYPSVQDDELESQSIEDKSQLDQLIKIKDTIIEQVKKTIDSKSAHIDKEWDDSLEKLKNDRFEQVFKYAENLLNIKKDKKCYKDKTEEFFFNQKHQSDMKVKLKERFIEKIDEIVKEYDDELINSILKNKDPEIKKYLFAKYYKKDEAEMYLQIGELDQYPNDIGEQIKEFLNDETESFNQKRIRDLVEEILKLPKLLEKKCDEFGIDKNLDTLDKEFMLNDKIFEKTQQFASYQKKKTYLDELKKEIEKESSVSKEDKEKDITLDTLIKEPSKIIEKPELIITASVNSWHKTGEFFGFIFK